MHLVGAVKTQRSGEYEMGGLIGVLVIAAIIYLLLRYPLRSMSLAFKLVFIFIIGIVGVISLLAVLAY